MIFNVVDKRSGMMYMVYDITYDKTGVPMFLIYKDEQWITSSATNFTVL